MQPLEILIRDARAVADGSSFVPPAATAENEVARILQICNACRYCEGFCAVFPAMTRRLEFGNADVHYLANLCHNCGACLHACQYAPPHEFAVNVPQAMARVRLRTYRLYAWPSAFGRLYERNGLVVSLALAAGFALFLILALALRGTLWRAAPGGSFYDVFPHRLMVGVFAPVFLFAVVALGVGVRRFWREMGPGVASAAETAEAGAAVATLKYLGGGHGDGCNNDDDRFSLARRHFHQTTFYGFLLCFLSTSVATLYHYLLGLEAPYAYMSLPALLGIAGGIGITVGTLGLGWLNLRRHPLQGDAQQKPMDLGFIAMLLFIAVSGLALAAWRASAAMPTLLALHLGAVIALFLTMPYGKFAHGPLRAAALLKWAIERRQPNCLSLADD
ncbi:tricarballylate utilization 4Fe-4S protein TcuB [Paraburkholderia tuberum]|uniref:Citrate/tricarballylate utilization protein n=1 Tax=Paraburkholderia tuberum TaxID=157910 RepID=A0A1H1J9B7_9BURK|nr:tricarballylate utilization 4Fe-4S protein TcuB [Paraburkholderia tuberum]SDR46380.1 citrate/tricarballylate utilization protein [Paraburkholderia tuberum]